MGSVRGPASAGSFYPSESAELERAVHDYIDDARGFLDAEDLPIRALIAPHGALEVSGPVAGAAYVQIEHLRDAVERVLLIGPATSVPHQGLLLPDTDSFATPLGTVALDLAALLEVEALPGATRAGGIHAEESSLNVQLPFLQVLLPDVLIAPVLIGGATTRESVDSLLDRIWLDRTLLVVSSNLSRGNDYNSALLRDRRTTQAIENLTGDEIEADSATAHIAIKSLLRAASSRQLSLRAIDVRNSGDTAGSRDSVVGFGAFSAA